MRPNLGNSPFWLKAHAKVVRRLDSKVMPCYQVDSNKDSLDEPAVWQPAEIFTKLQHADRVLHAGKSVIRALKANHGTEYGSAQALLLALEMGAVGGFNFAPQACGMCPAPHS